MPHRTLSRKRCGSETADGPVTAGQTMFCDPGQPTSFLCLLRGVLYHLFRHISPTGMLHKYPLPFRLGCFFDSVTES